MADTTTLAFPAELASLPINLTPNGETILKLRYLRKDVTGKVIETIPEMFWRVASGIVEHYKSPDEAMMWATAYYKLMTSRKFFPNSPTFTGAKTPLGQLAACFVMEITDDMGRDENGIFSTLRSAALVQQTGGGIGFSFSNLRPKGDCVNTTGQASGPISFMKVYDTAFGAIAQGGVRRGACMAVLSVDHPDIEEFINCKSVEGTLSNFNISVALTDEFMKCVENDKPFDLINPRTKLVTKTCMARAIFQAIAAAAHRNGEPGILFIDTINKANPVPHLYKIQATNPCVPADTIVMTLGGPSTVRSLIGRQFTVPVGLEKHANSTAQGFFHTGTKPVSRLMTNEGHSLVLTEDHPVLVQSGSVQTFIAAGRLTPGDKIKLGDFGAVAWGDPLIASREDAMAWLVGMFIGSGYMADGLCVLEVGGGRHLLDLVAARIRVLGGESSAYRHQRVGWSNANLGIEAVQSVCLEECVTQAGFNPHTKVFTTDQFATNSSAFACAFVRGMMDSDGLVKGTDMGTSVHLPSATRPHLEMAQQLLLQLGINSVINTVRQDLDELVISETNVHTFANRIGFDDPTKLQLLRGFLCAHGSFGTRRPHTEEFVATFKMLEPAGTKDVYDCTIPDVSMFPANGILVHNCGEQPLGPGESCCIGSINLAEFCANGKVDWIQLADVVHNSVRFLDDVIDANKFVPAVPKLQAAARLGRRIGLGIMGLADLCFHLRLGYGSPEMVTFVQRMMEFIHYHSMIASTWLAVERGPFPGIVGSIFDPANLRWLPPSAVSPCSTSLCPTVDWMVLYDAIRKCGVRNCAFNTIAPTGTIGSVAGCEGYGCEPAFALAYTRQVKQGDGTKELKYVSPLFNAALVALNLPPKTHDRVLEAVDESGSCQGITVLPMELREYFVVSQDIRPAQHIAVQSALQQFVDSSISKTINMPPHTTVDDVWQAYMSAWHSKCKGLTIYVTGSRDKVVLATGSSTVRPAAVAVTTPIVPTSPRTSNDHIVIEHPPLATTPFMVKRARPDILVGTTYRSPTPLGEAFITVNSTTDHEPFEVFLNVGKGGSDVAAVSEALGRLISLVLRMPSDTSPNARLRSVAEQLSGIGGRKMKRLGHRQITSLPDAISYVLDQHTNGTSAEADQSLIASTSYLPGDLCKDCGNATLLHIEGCKKCSTCGYSEC
jgi:ribonucleoside-diphosphate reductase alpha chain